jgi:hypothetical protein
MIGAIAALGSFKKCSRCFPVGKFAFFEISDKMLGASGVLLHWANGQSSDGARVGQWSFGADWKCPVTDVEGKWRADCAAGASGIDGCGGK